MLQPPTLEESRNMVLFLKQPPPKAGGAATGMKTAGWVAIILASQGPLFQEATNLALR